MIIGYLDPWGYNQLLLEVAKRGFVTTLHGS